MMIGHVVALPQSALPTGPLVEGPELGTTERLASLRKERRQG